MKARPRLWRTWRAHGYLTALARAIWAGFRLLRSLGAAGGISQAPQILFMRAAIDPVE